MKKLRDFKCPDGHVEEHFAEDEERQGLCDCGLESKRILSPIRAVLDPISGHFPSATEKWAKHHEEGAKPSL